MKISELFYSRQGEGKLTGTPSLFVRVSGCNLRCWFCDTPYASWNPEGINYSIDEILSQLEKLAPDCRHAVLTGGEPMIFPQLVELTEKLKARDFHITIETAGTKLLSVQCDLMSISPKLSNSAPNVKEHPRWHQLHQQRRLPISTLKNLISKYNYQLKFVLETPEELIEIETLLTQLGKVPANKVWLMPEGTEQNFLSEKEAWLIPLCQKKGFQFCPRKQIEWYGNKRGT
ncbi:7-carboxy-7-deazaguanine synthase QueE [Planctomycetales bacterium 10988]|nr:7-carboxy-7-deazaguanine synthase QueE [Planctomycetales bacterium 10988]